MKVFLSSTYEDLIEHRQKAIEALERLGPQVRGMEKFVAQPVEPSVACLSEIEVCELFVGIYAHRYGHIPHGSAVSITEAEFRHARDHKKPIFCFEVDPDYPWSPEMIENELGMIKLIALKKEIRFSLMRDTFTTPDNLASKIASSVVILPHHIGHRVKLSSRIPSGSDAQSQSVVSADYNTFRCIQRYWIGLYAASRTARGEPVPLLACGKSSP